MEGTREEGAAVAPAGVAVEVVTSERRHEGAFGSKREPPRRRVVAERRACHTVVAVDQVHGRVLIGSVAGKHAVDESHIRVGSADDTIVVGGFVALCVYSVKGWNAAFGGHE